MTQFGSESPQDPRQTPLETVNLARGPGIRESRLLEFGRILRRRTNIVVMTMVVAVAAASLFVGFVTPFYSASAVILFEPSRPRVDVSAAGKLGFDEAAIESQISLIQSLPVLQRVVSRMNLAEDPEFVTRRGLLDTVRSLFRLAPSSGASTTDIAQAEAADALRRRLNVARQPSTVLIDIGVNSYDRNKAAAIANAVAQAYFYNQSRSRLDASKAVASRLHEQVEQLKARAATSEAAVREYRNRMGAGPSDKRDTQPRLDDLQREAEADQVTYERYLARFKDAGAPENVDQMGSRIVAQAEPPISPSFPNIPWTLGLALFVGFGFGCAAALATDRLDRRIKTQDQAKSLGLPSLAAVPEINARELAHLARRGRAELESYDPRRARLLPPGLQPPLLRYAISRPMSPFAEAIRSIRFAIQHAAKHRAMQIICITSAVSGEGKSTVAANLAQSLSLAGRKVVLIEGDLRNPHLSRALSPGVRSGLLEVALEEMSLNQAVLVDPLTKLAFMPAPLPKDAALLTEFVSSEGMSNILAELRNHFDVVIVDAPPLVPLVDGRALVEQSDAVILTVGWDHTPEDIFLHAVELLNPVHERVIGTVLTRVDVGRLKLYGSYDSSAYSSPYILETGAFKMGKRGSALH
jgi:capsular exopolysaccharide synthesis family protein